VHAHRGRALLVTAKHPAHARRHVSHLGLPVDAVYGGVWQDGKAAVLRSESATAYVGDHVADVQAARSASVTAVAVATGPSHGTELADAGADVVLHSLVDFGEWLDEWLSSAQGC